MELNRISCSITGVKQMVFDYVHPTSPKTALLAVFTSLHYTIVHMRLAFGVAVAIYMYLYMNIISSQRNLAGIRKQPIWTIIISDTELVNWEVRRELSNCTEIHFK